MLFRGLLKAMQGFRTYETVDILVVDDLADMIDGLQVSKDIVLDLTPVEPAPSTPSFDLLAMPEIDLSRFGDIITLNFD
jgi:hypothetical protein